MQKKVDYVELPVTGGYVTKVDPDIAEKLKCRSLYIHKSNNYIYAAFKKHNNHNKLHRFVMNPEGKEMVDHINGDTLDNRRSNLRICDRSLNSRNKHVPSKSNSGFFGVHFHKNHKKYFSYNFHKKHISCGCYNNKYIASIFRDNNLFDLIRINVGLNFPEEIHVRDLRDFVNETSGRFFKICFVKRKDGTFREMLCRTGVTIDLTGEGLKFEPDSCNLILVWDVLKRKHRFIPIENVICLIFRKTNYLIKRDRLKLAA